MQTALTVDGPTSKDMTKFIILAVERTGSDLLRGLLDSHPECFAGHELFNGVYFELGCVPWYLDPKTGGYNNPFNFDRELVDLREKSPGEMIERLMEVSRAENYRAAGFKLMYYHGENKRAARDYLVSQSDLRVIHLKRKNLLRRLVSLKRAQVTKGWNYTLASPNPPLPQVELSLMECVTEFCHVERQQDLYEDLFKNHALLTMYYEDLAQDPHREAARAAEFLGLSPYEKFEVRYKKIATDSLKDAFPNYAELKETFHRWAAYFDE